MKVLFTTGALLGAVAVAAGAFGAHTLKSFLTADQLHTFDTAVRYHFYHVFAILVCGILALKYPGLRFALAGKLFLAGIVLFSGSLYLLACRDILNLGSFSRILGPVTPLGGLFFIIGWLWTAIQTSRIPSAIK